MKLQSIVHFRAIAIIAIVAEHALAVAPLPEDGPAVRVFVNLLTGGTTFFVFISGYMFNHVFARRFAYRAFLLTKLRNVLVPYLFLSVPVAAYYVARNPGFAAEKLGDAPPVLQAAKVVLTGQLFPAYWFVPFILLVFICAPLHMRFIRLGRGSRLAVIAVALGLALVVHRPVDNLNVLQSLVYFTPVYLAGIAASADRERLLALLRRCEPLLWSVALALAVAQTATGALGNSHKPFLAWQGLDWMLMQKAVLTLAIFATLEARGHRLPAALATVSETSFAIFFLHPIALILIGKAIAPVGPLPPFGGLAAVTVVALALCIGAAKLAKASLADRSRYLVGH